MTERKYKPGIEVAGIGELWWLISQGRSLYFGHSVRNSAFFMSQTLRTIRNAMRAGSIKIAVPIKKEPKS